MKKTLDKKTLFLCVIVIISLLSSIFVNFKFGITTLLTLLFIYILATNLYMIKVYKGAKAYKSENYSKALDYSRSAIISPWCSVNIIIDYLVCELKYGKASIANEYIEEIFTKRNFKPNDLLNLKITESIVLWKNNNRQESISLLRNLLEKNKNTFLYETLTSILICNGNIQEAKSVLSTALAFNKDSNILKSNNGEIKFKEGNYDEASKIFYNLINEDIKFVEPFYYLGLIETKNNNFDKAKELLEKSQNLNQSLITLVKFEDIEQAYNRVIFKSLTKV